MQIQIAPGYFIVVEYKGNLFDLGDRARERLFNVIDGIHEVKEKCDKDYFDEYR